MTRPLFTAALLVALGSGTAQAEGTWTLGLLIDADTGLYVGAQDEADLLPYIAFEADQFEVSVHDGLTYDMLEGETLGGVTGTLSLRLAPRWSPDFSDDPIFTDLSRDTAVEAGLAARAELANFYLSAEALTDISDVHNGTEARLAVGFEQSVGRAFFEVEVGAVHRNAALNQYLFGVSATEATATRSAYTAGDSTTGFTSITGGYALTDTMALVGQIAFEDVGDLVASPLVAHGESTSFRLGLIFEF